MSTAAAVRVTSFGQGRYEYLPTGTPVTVEEALRATGVSAEGRRVAVNGHAAGTGATVVEGDEVTVVPRVQGG